MEEQLERIKNKIDQLKFLDKDLQAFGSQSHKYKLNKTKSADELVEFEKANQITLPTGLSFIWMLVLI